MKKTYKQALLATALVGAVFAQTASQNLAQAGTKNGFYLQPQGEVIFVDKTFTKGVTSVGVGGGGGATVGYQMGAFQIELAADYQYYGGKGTTNHTISVNYAKWIAGVGAYKGSPGILDASGAPGAPGNPTLTQLTTAGGAFNRAVSETTKGLPVATTVDSKEGFIPITLGINYLIPLAKVGGGVFSITPGIAGGVWFHTVDRSISTQLSNNSASIPAILTTDKANETKGVVVPSLALNYAPMANLTISLAGKFYIVPGGYSDNYTASQQAAANKAALAAPSVTAATLAANLPQAGQMSLTPSYNAVGKNFWYGGLNLAVQYTF